jgi:hypothetical protein
MTEFVAALRAEWQRIGDRPRTMQGHESKPLSSRQVRRLISDAVRFVTACAARTRH